MELEVFVVYVMDIYGENYQQTAVYVSVEAAITNVRTKLIKVIEDDRQGYESWLRGEVDSLKNYRTYLDETVIALDESMKAWLPSSSSSTTTASNTSDKNKKLCFLWHDFQYVLVIVPLLAMASQPLNVTTDLCN